MYLIGVVLGTPGFLYRGTLQVVLYEWLIQDERFGLECHIREVIVRGRKAQRAVNSSLALL